MTAVFTAEEILEICDGRLAAGMMPDQFGPINTDTRSLTEGQWYLALSGERFDGHDFLGDAFSAGAIGAIVAERSNYAIGNAQFPLLAVGDTLLAYHALARNWRRRLRPLVIGVTGSSGKTTTKEMCAAVLCAGLRCHKSKANENNEIGVAKTLLAMPDDTQVVVIEMAMRGAGQIDQLGACAQPDIAIITNAGTAHLELLGSVENIVRAKCELLAHLDKKKGVAIIGHPTEMLLSAAKQVFDGRILCCDKDEAVVESVTPDLTSFLVRGLSTIFAVRAHGEPLIEDAWCAVKCGIEAGLDESVIGRGLRTFEPVGGRGNRVTAVSGALILDETYNGNPESVRASISGMLEAGAFPHAQKFVVLGELAELGPSEKELHKELGQWLKGKSFTALLTVGQMARHIAEGAEGAGFEIIACLDQDEAERTLTPRLTEDSCVLVKGSRRANLDKLVARLVPAAS